MGWSRKVSAEYRSVETWNIRACTHSLWEKKLRPLTFDFPIRARGRRRSSWISRSDRGIPYSRCASAKARAGYTIRDVKASPLSINSMHLFGDAELDQGLRPQAQVGARRLKIAGQDAFELFNLPSMEKRRLLLRFSFFFSFPTLVCPLSQPTPSFTPCFRTRLLASRKRWT